MNVLVLGSGGREHALTAAVARSPRVEHVYCAPGNAGTGTLATNVSLDLRDLDSVVAFARTMAIDLTVVGPEGPLEAGIVDRFHAAGLRILGPTAAAARLETSKAWAKVFMQRYDIPTAPFAIAESPAIGQQLVRAMWRESGLVVKADGLAAGKGVVVAETREQALKAIELLMDRQTSGAAGNLLVIEERLTGPEISLIIAVDGQGWQAFPTAQDHKLLHDGDLGPNTGGMGAFAPVAMISSHGMRAIETTILAPLMAGLQAEELDYRGFLFLGLMMTPTGPQVLEFNCRLGDPEAQVLLPGLETDFVELAGAILSGTLSDLPLVSDGLFRLGVVATAKGYPGPTPGHQLITGLAHLAHEPGITVFHGGTDRDAVGGVVTRGGRVLTVVGEGRTLDDAQRLAYAAVESLRFDGEMPHFRRDIGRRALLVDKRS
ncbi:MAG: phosphoribosylamine--glycine ligase [Candidatus Sericytochromatia bacterium]|nr:phosphoribosylamine--glycine ligase [Candidatus Sericytochromatia bacterium]